MLTYNVRDYGATGNGVTDDTNAIQAALDAARDAGGGRVYIPAGTYILAGSGDASDGALRVYSNTELYGEGMGTAELKLQDGFASKITGMIRTPVNEVTHDIIIRDLTINGNRENTTAEVDGIMTGVLPGSPLQDTNILIERVEIHDVSRIAFNPHEQTTNLTIRDSVAHHNSWDGFIADFVTNAVYENNVAYANDRHGFNVVTHSENVILRNNTSYDNAEYGIIVQRGAGSQTIKGWQDMLNNNILIEGNTVYGNDRGIGLKQTEDSQIIGNNIYDNDREGIYLEGARENIIDGNIVNTISDAIEIRNYSGSLGGPGDSYGNIIINNILNSKTFALIESGLTTNANTYADNIINTLTKLGKGALVIADSEQITYTKIVIIPTLPSIYYTTPGEISEAQNLRGTVGDDIILGASGNDILKGLAGNDILIGGKGDDYLYGNDGDDILYGGLGADILQGGNGIDTYVYRSIEEGGDTIIAFRPTTGEKLDFADLFANVSTFDANRALLDGFIRLQQQGNDVALYIDMDGKTGQTALETLYITFKDAQASQIGLNNFILPHNANTAAPKPAELLPAKPTELADIITGTSGSDTIKGLGGDDILIGGDGNDSLYGNDGNDILYGGMGADTLKGGTGADIFVYENILEGGDSIIDFRTNDRIDLAALLEDFTASRPATVQGLIDEGFISIESKGNNIFTLSVDSDGRAGSAAAVHLADITFEGNKVFDANYITI